MSGMLLIGIFANPVYADGPVARADSHAPIGVMGDHFHKKGEWMFSYRFMSMSMEDNLVGEDSISPEEIVSTIPNTFFGSPMQPPTLRVVPVSMTMDMHMFGAMYAPTDWLTLMGMTNYTKKEMDHITFAGPQGTQRLGNFTTRSEGIGDTRLSGLIKLYDSDRSKFHASIGVSLPTGDIDNTDQILTPMNTRPSPRLPYPMQLGSGSYDLLLGLTYTQYHDAWSWGAQWNTIQRVEDNDEGYRLGDENKATAWLSYLINPGFSVSARLQAYDRDNISGLDPLIRAPVQTADPNHQGIERIDAAIGINLLGSQSLIGHRISLEFATPIDQDLDGPQLETEWQFTLGYQYAF